MLSNHSNWYVSVRIEKEISSLAYQRINDCYTQPHSIALPRKPENGDSMQKQKGLSRYQQAGLASAQR
jgi:hypothetical protein